MSVTLDEAQRQALQEMHNGCILCGGVGSGKTRTALAYYHCYIGKGRLKPKFEPMTEHVDLYVITTAATRDRFGWEKEMASFLLMDEKTKEVSESGEPSDIYGGKVKVVVDSWNNIKKYVGIENAFFIFDEQRVVGSGVWVKSFLKIAKVNRWILLSATPGDKWIDYAPVFVANGFYENLTEFRQTHVNMQKRGTFWTISGYWNTRKLERLRDRLLVELPVERETVQHHIDIWCIWDRELYRQIMKTRWDPWKNEPLDNASGLCQALRKVVNTNVSRANALIEILEEHPKAIIFYNYNYELDLLKELLLPMYGEELIGEWNGQKHQDIPSGNKWVYLVQYFANEGWQCTRTDTMIFWSQNYSYKTMIQAAGRIDRRNTSYKDLYYYHLKSKAPIDLAIGRALNDKKQFNEGRYFNRIMKREKEIHS